MNVVTRAKVREALLLDGLADYIDLNAVDWNVRQHNPSASRPEAHNETLTVIRSLVSEGLVVLGAMSGEGGRWQAWDEPLEASLQKTYDDYVTRFGAAGSTKQTRAGASYCRRKGTDSSQRWTKD